MERYCPLCKALMLPEERRFVFFRDIACPNRFEHYFAERIAEEIVAVIKIGVWHKPGRLWLKLYPLEGFTEFWEGNDSRRMTVPFVVNVDLDDAQSIERTAHFWLERRKRIRLRWTLVSRY